MHFLKMKNHLVVKLFIIVLSFCAVSILSSPAYAYQNSDSSQTQIVIEDEPMPEITNAPEAFPFVTISFNLPNLV